MKECVVVLGMHRSGTSVLAGLVSLQGFSLGVTEMPPQDYNPKGFFENQKIYELNDSILMGNGGSWHDFSFTIQDIKPKDLRRHEVAIKELIQEEFGSEERIFIKDPRMCLLFPLWEKVLKEMGYKIRVIFIWRSPMEVFQSLESRNKMAVEKSLMLWSHYFFQAEKNSRDYERFVVRYDNDFRELDTFFKGLGKFLEVELTENMYQAAHELYTPKLKHHLIELKRFADDLPAYLRDLVSILKSNDFSNHVELDELADEFKCSKKYYLYNQAKQEEELETKGKKIAQQQELLTQLQLLHDEQNKELENKNAKNLQQQQQLGQFEQLYDEQTNELDRSIRKLVLMTEISNKGNEKINQLEASLSEEKLQHDRHKQELEDTKQELSLAKQETAIIKLDYTETREEAELLDLRLVNADDLFKKMMFARNKNNKLHGYHEERSHFMNKLFLFFVSKEKRALLKDRELISRSNLFSPLYYLTLYPDVSQSGMDPLMHFCEYGWKEGRQPSETFDIDSYVKDNRMISEENINPLVHFIQANKDEYIDGRITKNISNSIKPVLARYLKKIHKQISNTETYVYFEPKLTLEIKKEIKAFKKPPLMSIIIPVFNVEKKWLEKAIISVENQWYENWEISIADDASTNIETISFLKSLDNPKIKIKYLKENGNISNASNEALKAVNGQYIVLMDHDDELTPDALYEIVKSINVDGAEFIYSDEDKLEMDGSFCDPNFKPDYAPDTFLSTNYLSHLGAIKKTLVDKVGGFSIGLEGAQDYDLYLKVLEYTTKISHIQKVLYHWRKIPGSTAASFGDKSYANEAGRLALQRAMERRKISANVIFGKSPGLYRIQYELVDNPLISIIIPFKDMPELLKTCIESILSKSTYQNYEIIGISNNSTDNNTFAEMKRLENLDSRIQFHELNIPFNFSKINNYAVTEFAKGEQLVFLNNDIEIITPEWIEELLMYSQQKRVGVVGSKLYYPNDTIQHAGLVITPYTSHSIISVFNSFPRNSSGYGSRLAIVNNYSAVTAACMMLKKDLFMDVGGFDEENLKIAYNDVDLCLTIKENGLLNIYTPFCEAYHHESISRGLEDTTEKLMRCGNEQIALKSKHPDTFVTTDPYYNKNLDGYTNNFSISSLQTTHRADFIGQEFTHEIKKNIHIKPKNSNYLCVFSHFDVDNKIQDYVIHYLKSLSKFADIVFVSTCEKMKEKEIEKIKLYCNQIIIKKNIGYDFGAWKTGMDLSDNNLQDYENLILCNDSVYGPFYNINETILSAMKNNDMFSMTDSHENQHHLQSYFMIYNRKAFTHPVFTDFWGNLKTYNNKRKLVIENEIKYHNRLIKSDLSTEVLCPAKEAGNLNQLHFCWDELIINRKFPFIKIELLKDNPRNMDIKNWEKIINETGYDSKLIENHLKRM